MARKGRSSLFARLFRQAAIFDLPHTATVACAFDAAFAALRKSGARDEYVYRSALTHNILLGSHSLNTACMLTEFRAGFSKADVVILNGTSTVYEIKSDRDSLTRLATQIANYRKVFARVYVIAADQHVRSIVDTVPFEVGILGLRRWNEIRKVRDAIDRADRVCPIAMFESLRTAEAVAVLQRLGVQPPDVPNTLLRADLRERFLAFDPAKLHAQMVSTLKITRDLAPLSTLIDRLPQSLKPRALSVPLRRADRDRVVEAVMTPLRIAAAWT
jgi:hypothetical protein